MQQRYGSHRAEQEKSGRPATRWTVEEISWKPIDYNSEDHGRLAKIHQSTSTSAEVKSDANIAEDNIDILNN